MRPIRAHPSHERPRQSDACPRWLSRRRWQATSMRLFRARMVSWARWATRGSVARTLRVDGGKLIARYRADAKLPALREVLAADCPRLAPHRSLSDAGCITRSWQLRGGKLSSIALG